MFDYRIDETLEPASRPLRTMYSFQSPDRLSYQLSTGGQTVIVGGPLVTVDSDRSWVAATLPVTVPEFAVRAPLSHRMRGSWTQVNPAASR